MKTKRPPKTPLGPVEKEIERRTKRCARWQLQIGDLIKTHEVVVAHLQKKIDVEMVLIVALRQGRLTP